MSAWRRRLENLLLKTLRALWKKDLPHENGASIEEVAAKRLLKQAEGELEEWKAGDQRRGEIFKKLHARVDVLKKESKARKEQARELRREVDKSYVEVMALRDKLVVVRNKNRRWELYGTANILRPGLTPFVPPDIRVEKDWAEYLKLHEKVWDYPMRLGVYFQHGPKPITWEKFPAPRQLNEWPMISVATPSYNSGEFIDRTMKSVLSEDYPHVEYFVADGGSKDDSVKIIESHSAKLSGWLSESDKGASDAINKGLCRSKGEIMTWLNADDLWMPGVLKFVASYFAKHPEVDVVYGHRLVVDDKDNQVGRWVLPRHDSEMILWADYIPQETMFWRRSIWEKTGGRLDDSFRFAFDWELLLRFQRAGARIVRLPYVMGMFRVHRAQMSSAKIDTLGLSEMKRLRDREIGAAFNEVELARMVTHFQKKAIRCDRLLNRGVRW